MDCLDNCFDGRNGRAGGESFIIWDLLIGDHLTIIQLLGMVIILVTITVLSVKQSENNAFPPSLGLLVLVLFKNTASFA